MQLSNFSRSTFVHEDISHYVYEAGEGPPIIVMHELPGMTKECVLFAEKLIADCHAVFTAHFVDEEGHPTQKALDRLIDFYKEQLY